MNLFRCTKDGSLDRKYLRVCVVYRLLKKKVIRQERALELLAQKHSDAEMRTLRGTVDLWMAHPLKEASISQNIINNDWSSEWK